MLPSLTAAARRRRPRRRPIVAASGATLVALSVLVSLHGSPPTASQPAASVAEALAPGTWAISIPATWFIAPVSGLRPGDRLDVLALHAGEHATASAVAFDLLVVSVDERAVTIESGADDVTALSVARASGLLLVPLLRSTK